MSLSVPQFLLASDVIVRGV